MAASTRYPISRSLLTVALLLSAGACTDGITAPEVEPTPEPVTVFDLDLTTRYIEVLGTCDENVFGNSTDGEFQYKYTVSGAGKSYTRSTTDYNSPFSRNHQKGKGETIDFTNRTYVWRGLSAPEGAVQVTFWGSEWDGPTKDSRMKNISDTRSVIYDTGKKTRTVTVGSGACKLRLYYYATWTPRRLEG